MSDPGEITSVRVALDYHLTVSPGLNSERRCGMEFNDSRLPDRLWSYLSRQSETDCWVWVGSSARKGHRLSCKVSVGGKQRSVWLWTWEAANGAIPPSQYIVRACPTELCCNPSHWKTSDYSGVMEVAVGTKRQLTGQRFGYLTVGEYSRRMVVSRGKGGSSRKLWMCRCDCGADKEIREDALLGGEARSCGCMRYEALVQDKTGMRFGKLLVVERDATWKSGGNARWVVRCDCGRQKIVAGGNLVRTSSCGCTTRRPTRGTIRRDGVPVKSYWKRGQSRDPRYGIWTGMKDRCLNPRNANYPNYGGRGITISERWLGMDGFFNFAADVGQRPDEVGPTGRHCWSLDRIDPNGNYEPGNVRWANQTQQMQNTRTARSRVARVLDAFRDKDPALVAELRKQILGDT